MVDLLGQLPLDRLATHTFPFEAGQRCVRGRSTPDPKGLIHAALGYRELMFQVGTAIEFTAQHIMPGVEGPEGELHEHDYRLDVVVEREKLDERGMVCDLDVLDVRPPERRRHRGGQEP